MHLMTPSHPTTAALLFILLATCAPPREDIGNGKAQTTGPFAGKTLTIAMPPGRIEDFNRIIAPEFERLTGAVVRPIGLRSADQVARLRIEKRRPSTDVLWIDLGEAQLLAGEGLLARPSERDIPNLKHIRDHAKSELGIAPITFSSALGFIYNTEIVKEPPTSWADLWSPRFRHQLALFDFGSSLGPVTLVMAARLNGGSETNIEPGFRKLAELKENAVSFRTSGPGNNQLVAQGEAGVTFGLANQALELKAAGAPVEWLVPSEGAIALPQGFQVVEGVPELELAWAFVNYALGTEAQTRLAHELLVVVTNKQVVLDPTIAPLVPVENILYFDFEEIGAERGAWTNRFNREILGG
ncbi:MAG: extracellular solute-binding protein [Acidobacteriota bacterium]